MSGYDRLATVDQYEESHDNNTAVLLACHVMPEYLANLKRPLPDGVAQAVKVAREYSAGSVQIERLREADQQLSRFLKEPKHIGEYDKGAISVGRAEHT